MDAKRFLLLCQLLCLASLGLAARQPHFLFLRNTKTVFDVTNFGAVGDGRTDDSQAFLKAWNEACASRISPTLTVPPRKTFLISEISFTGPCRSKRINIQILGNLLAHNDISPRNYDGYWIQFYLIKGLTITGPGQIDGQGSSWWDCRIKHQCSTPPTAVKIINCEDVNVNQLKILNGQQMHLAVYGSTRVRISDVMITAPEDSPNTDGIHVQNSHQVEITRSTIGTGDDCISIGTNTSNVIISYIHCGPGHGISVGSLGENGLATVEQVHVSNCTFNSTMNGARIKTWQGGSGYARGITFTDIVVHSIGNPILIDQYYCGGSHGCANKTSAVKVSDVSFVNVRGTSSEKSAVTLACSETVACTGITLEHIHIRSAVPNNGLKSYCLNAKVTLRDVIPALSC